MAKTMTPEQCAARMQAFLARPPRKEKTRKYVASLPKRDVRVSAAEYLSVSCSNVARAKDVERYAEWVKRGKPPSPPELRKDRMRPKASSARLLERLIDAQGGVCGICGKKNDLWEMDVDHVTPRAAGGGNTDNRVAAHRICNRKKADRAPTGCELIFLAGVNLRLSAA